MTATTCPTATCAFTNGVELIPKNEDYCAPLYMTDDLATILECSNAKDFAGCMPMYANKDTSVATASAAPTCMWRKGAVVANNTVNETPAPLFEVNFCHPFEMDDKNT